jgi:hypothetical protein
MAKRTSQVAPQSLGPLPSGGDFGGDSSLDFPTQGDFGNLVEPGLGPEPSPKKGGFSMFWIISILVIVAISLYVYFLWKKGTPNVVTTAIVNKIATTLTPTPSTTAYDRHRTTLPPSEICLKMSDDFGVRPNNPGSAEGVPSVLEAWEKNRCHTVPTVWSCQNISDAFDTSPTSKYQNPGYHMYKQRGCTTSPSVTCQSISNKYKTRPGYWGEIGDDVMTDVQGDVLRDAWRNRHCQTIPDSLTCQDMSNIYNMSPTSQGIAPPSIFGTYKTKKCKSSPMTCQYISDVYMVGGTESAFAFNSSEDMNYADIAWQNQKCNTDAPPTGYVTSLKNRTYTTGKTVYSSNKLIHCLQECITDSTCDMIEYNPVSQECTNKGNVDFNGETKQTDGVITYRKRTST